MYRLCPQSGQNRRNNLRNAPHKSPSITSPRQSFHVCALYCGHVEAQMPNNTGLCERGEGGREERECSRVTDEREAHRRWLGCAPHVSLHCSLLRESESRILSFVTELTPAIQLTRWSGERDVVESACELHNGVFLRLRGVISLFPISAGGVFLFQA
jgi:hypothetical protein